MADPEDIVTRMERLRQDNVRAIKRSLKERADSPACDPDARTTLLRLLEGIKDGYSKAQAARG